MSPGSLCALARGFVARAGSYRVRTPALLVGFGFVVVVTMFLWSGPIAVPTFHERFPLLHLPVDEHGFCQRTVVHRFSNSNERGIASELLAHVRAAALQGALGYALVLVTREYIYGDVASFWMQPRYPCSLPVDALDTTSAARFADADLGVAPRVFMTHNSDHMQRLDTLVREQSVNTELMRELGQREKFYRLVSERLTLPYGETVSPGMVTAFLQQSEALARVTRPTREMQTIIDRLSAKLGLDQRRSRRRRPVIALQIDIEDETTMQADILAAGTHLSANDILPFFHAAELALARLYDADITPYPKTFSKESKGGKHKPLLVVMTDNSDKIIQLQNFDTDGIFEIVHSPRADLSPKEEEEYLKLLETPPSYNNALSSDSDGSITTRFTGTSSQAPQWEKWMLFESSAALRLALSRHLIAELTVYATRSDAFIVRGSSDLGRLAMLLAGEEGVIGFGTQRLVGGRVRSIDVPFYPTANRSAIFQAR